MVLPEINTPPWISTNNTKWRTKNEISPFLSTHSIVSPLSSSKSQPKPLHSWLDCWDLLPLHSFTSLFQFHWALRAFASLFHCSRCTLPLHSRFHSLTSSSTSHSSNSIERLALPLSLHSSIALATLFHFTPARLYSSIPLFTLPTSLRFHSSIPRFHCSISLFYFTLPLHSDFTLPFHSSTSTLSPHSFTSLLDFTLPLRHSSVSCVQLPLPSDPLVLLHSSTSLSRFSASQATLFHSLSISQPNLWFCARNSRGKETPCISLSKTAYPTSVE